MPPLHRLAILLLAALLGLAALSGCGSLLATPEPVEITFVLPSGSEDFYTPLRDQFQQANPNFIITLKPLSGRSLYDATTLESDCLVNDTYGLLYIQQRGRAEGAEAWMALDELIAEDRAFDRADFVPVAMQLVSNNGQTWALPAGLNPVVMYYNKELFDKAGLPYPQPGWTWDEFLADASAIRDPENKVWGYAPGMDFLDPLLFLYQHGGGIVDDIENPTKITFDTPLNVEALDWFGSLFTTYQVAPPSPIDLGSSSSFHNSVINAAFQQRLGIWTGTYEQRGGRADNIPWNFRWGMVTLPRDAQDVTYADSLSYAVVGSTDQPKACWQWISFLSQQMGRDSLLAPSRLSLLESAEYANLVGPDVAAATRAAMQGAFMPPNLDGFDSAMRGFDYAVRQLINGQMTAAEAAKYAQEKSGSSPAP